MLKRDEFVKRVTEIGELRSRKEAKRAIRVTLKQRLAGNEPDNHLAAQLPEDLAEPLAGEDGRAVALVLQEAVTTGKMNDVRHQFKDEYVKLFDRQGE